ncbi:hypothetical protein MSP8887_01749 [Marinomonas spartinae]|nr:hypothetical protein MSP8887_01749 [Marinomonas spartinae]
MGVSQKLDPAIILEGSAAAISEYQGYKNDMQSDCW